MSMRASFWWNIDADKWIVRVGWVGGDRSMGVEFELDYWAEKGEGIAEVTQRTVNLVARGVHATPKRALLCGSTFPHPGDSEMKNTAGAPISYAQCFDSAVGLATHILRLISILTPAAAAHRLAKVRRLEDEAANAVAVTTDALGGL